MNQWIRAGMALASLAAATACGQGTWYVSPAGRDDYAGTSWDQAFATISNAVAHAAGGEQVLVSNGVYVVTTQLTVSAAIRVESVNGPDVTTIARTGAWAAARFRILELAHANALVSGFSITNAHLPQSVVGSALYLRHGTVSNCIIRDNWTDRGATVVMTNGLITRCALRSNSEVGNYSGVSGVRMEGAGGIVSDCVFSGNRSEALGVLWAHGSGGLVRNCIFTNNSSYVAGAYPSGQIVCSENSTVITLENCIIADNVGRGVYFAAVGAKRVRHCTIVGNRSLDNTGNGVYLNGSGSSVSNSIVYLNGPERVQVGRDIAVVAGSVGYSCMYPLVAGPGNTAADPAFVAAGAADYALQPGSPCIDAGTNIGVAADISGSPRPVDGNGDGVLRPDMGACEAPAAGSGALRCGIVASDHEGVDSLAVSLAAAAAGSDTSIVYYGWDFGDGSATSGPSLAAVSHSFGPGLFTVSLTLSNASLESARAVSTNAVRVGPSVAHVAPGGSHTYPYDTWGKAATNIQAALDATVITAVTGIPPTVVVRLTNGVYLVTSQVEVRKAVTVEGANGPEQTFIGVPGATLSRHFQLSHPAATLSGLTLTNGNLPSTHGASIYGAWGGVVTNCVIASNRSDRGSIVYMISGLVTRCVVRDNRDTGNYFGCGGLRISGGGTVERTTFSGNRGGSEAQAANALWLEGNCAARFCVFTNNRALNPSGVAANTIIASAGDVIRNCLVANNTGRGIYLANGGTVQSCTLSGNAVYGSDGDGIYVNNGGVENCISWANGSGAANIARYGTARVEFTDTAPALTGNGNKSQDPVFRSAGGDFRLDPGSPGVDAGTNQAWMSGATDLAGSNRVIGAAVDMGAYELPAGAASALGCNFLSDRTEGFTNLTVEFTANPSGANTNIVYYWWTFGNGATEEGDGRRTVTATYATVGYYDVSLTVSNDAGESASRYRTGYVYAVPDVMHVATNGAHQAPFETWARAATNIQSAIDSARVDGARRTTVLVTNGTYSINRETEVSRGIVLRSVNGPAATAIRRGSGVAVLRLAWLHDAAAIVAGFTFTNGNVNNDVGGMLVDAGTVSNCWFIGNTANRGIGGLRMNGGMVSNCVFRNNVDSGNYLTCGGVSVGGGILCDATIIGNRGGSDLTAIGGLGIGGGTAMNCIVVANGFASTGSCAGGVSMTAGALRNALIAGNAGRGVRLAGGSCENSTIVRNAQEGLDMSAGAVTNVIVYDNNSGGSNLTAGSTNLVYSCCPELAGGAGNITVSPAFRDPGLGYGTNSTAGDYRLQRRSPCVNAGTNLWWMPGARDLDGSPRLAGDRTDMGAYELPAPPQGSLLLVR